MIVVSINTETRRTALFSVPRNLEGVPFPPAANTDLETFPDILNALWQYAEGRPELFPGAREPGATALKATIGHLLALRIDYYAMVDLRGFVEVVDALGGVTVNVPRPIYDAGVSPPTEDED
jgi:anionic cell wall polymer biosynthesis LytR-Cps2A-Psr (LCP) family protein